MKTLEGVKVLVIGEDARSFLGVVRSLGRQGATVYVVSLNHQSIALKSRYITEAKCYSQLAMTDNQWQSAVATYANAHAVDVIFPCDERSIFPLQQMAKLGQISAKVAVANEPAFSLFLDKWKTKALANELNVPVAKGELVNPSQRTQFNLQDWTLPVVYKPLQSYQAQQLNARNKVMILRDQTQFKAAVNEASDNFVIEEFVEGVGEGISVFAIEGEVKAAFAHRREWESNNAGGSGYRVSIECQPEILEAVNKLAKQTSMSGLAMFEFKKASPQQWILVEVNARVWGSMPLAQACGFDFPAYHVEWLVGRHREHYPTQYKIPFYGRSLSLDFNLMRQQFSQQLSQGKAKGLSYLARRVSELTRNLIGRESIDSFAWDDLKPFGSELASITSLFSDFAVRKVGGLRAPVRYWKRRQLAQKLASQDYERIWFMCYGNIVRSPFAEFSFMSLMEDANVDTSMIESIGVHPVIKRSSPNQFIEVAQQFGVDLTPHQSKHFEQFYIGPNDLLFYFDEKNQTYLRENTQVANQYNLADFVGSVFSRQSFIEDPYGKSKGEAQRCYASITQALNDIGQTMIKEKA